MSKTIRLILAVFLIGFTYGCAGLAKESVVLTGHTDEVKAVVFLPDGQRLAAAGMDKTIRIWDFRTGQQLAVLRGHVDNVSSLSPSPDGEILLSGSYGAAFLWDLKRYRELSQYDAGDPSAACEVVIFPDGRRAAVTDYIAGTGCVVRLWDLETHRELMQLQGDKFTRLTQPMLHPDGRRLFAINQSSVDDEKNNPSGVYVWDLSSGQLVQQLAKGKSFLAADISPDGRWIAAGGEIGLGIWDLQSGKEIHHSKAGSLFFGGVKFSPDGKYFLVDSLRWFGRSGIALWDAKSFRKLADFPGAVAPAFSPDGKWIAAAGNGIEDYTVRVWRIK